MENYDLAKGIEDLKHLGIINIDESNLDAELTEDINDKDIDLNIDLPHIVFMKDDLVKALQLGANLIQPKSENLVLRSISIFPIISQRMTCFETTNDMSLFRYKSELLGEPNEILNEIICLPILYIQKVLRLMGKHVMIYKDTNNYYIRLLGGDLLIDVQEPNVSYLQFKGTLGDKIAEISLDELGLITKTMLPLINSDIRGENRKISLLGQSALYLSSIYYVEANINTPNFLLKVKDAEFISRLYKYNKNSNISIYQTNNSKINRYILKCDNIDYQMLVIPTQVTELMREQMNKLKSETMCFVNYNQLLKQVSLASDLPNSTGSIGFKPSLNKLFSYICTSKGESEFSIDAEYCRDITEDNDIIYLKAEPLKKLLQSFNYTDKLGIAINNNGLTVVYNNITAVFINM